MIYLCGPINGCTDDEATTWREQVKKRFGAENCIDPMRRDYRGREHECVAEIVEGDLTDIDNSRIVLANCWQCSWGTAMEIHYAANPSVPRAIIAIVPEGSRISPWLRFHTTDIVYSLEDAYKIIEDLI